MRHHADFLDDRIQATALRLARRETGDDEFDTLEDLRLRTFEPFNRVVQRRLVVAGLPHAGIDDSEWLAVRPWRPNRQVRCIEAVMDGDELRLVDLRMRRRQ